MSQEIFRSAFNFYAMLVALFTLVLGIVVGYTIGFRAAHGEEQVAMGQLNIRKWRFVKPVVQRIDAFNPRMALLSIIVVGFWQFSTPGSLLGIIADLGGILVRIVLFSIVLYVLIDLLNGDRDIKPAVAEQPVDPAKNGTKPAKVKLPSVRDMDRKSKEIERKKKEMGETNDRVDAAIEERSYTLEAYEKALKMDDKDKTKPHVVRSTLAAYNAADKEFDEANKVATNAERAYLKAVDELEQMREQVRLAGITS